MYSVSRTVPRAFSGLRSQVTSQAITVTGVFLLTIGGVVHFDRAQLVRRPAPARRLSPSAPRAPPPAAPPPPPRPPGARARAARGSPPRGGSSPSPRPPAAPRGPPPAPPPRRGGAGGSRRPGRAPPTVPR